MKCQFCNREKVDRVFYVNWMGTVYQIPVCSDCLNKMWRKASEAGQTEEFKKYTGWWPGNPLYQRQGHDTHTGSLDLAGF